MPERPQDEAQHDADTDAPAGPDTDDLGFRDEDEERAYERAQPDQQPTVSSDPEPDDDPSHAG